MIDENSNLRLEWYGLPPSITVKALTGDKVIHLDDVKITNSKQRETFAKAVASRRGEECYNPVLDDLLRLASEVTQAREEPPPEDAPGEPEPFNTQEAVVRAEDYLASPDLMTRICDDIILLGVAGERALSATVYLVGTSRLLAKPLALIVQGPSSSGKSYVLETVAKLFPPEVVVHAHQMSSQALFHMKPGSLVHRFVVAGERSRLEDDDRAEATRALREMISSGRLCKLIASRVGNGIETVEIEQDGPIAYVESTTLSQIFEEDANRCLIVPTDERTEQTRKILFSMALRASGVGPSPEQVGEVVATHHALQRLLKPADVVIPFAPDVERLFDVASCEARRAFGQILAMVNAVALLHQRQRERDDQGRIVATLEDYAIAERLLREPMSRHREDVPAPARRFLDLLWQEFGDQEDREFTTTGARQIPGTSRGSVHGYLKALAENGYIEEKYPAKGNRPAVWKLLPGRKPSASSPLPSVENLHPLSGAERMNARQKTMQEGEPVCTEKHGAAKLRSFSDLNAN